MKNRAYGNYLILGLISLTAASCKIIKQPIQKENRTVPAAYLQSKDSTNTAKMNWKDYFADPKLVALIDTALVKNQELHILQQEIEIGRNEIRARKGEYLPFGNIQAGIGADKSGKYTWNGQSEEDWKSREEKPRYIGDFTGSAVFSWELDIWNKLHQAKDAAVNRYLASVEGRNFAVTHLIAEIADSYYELMASDNLLEIIENNIQIQSDALKVVKMQKQSARVTQLAVNRFEAQLLNTQNLRYEVQQRIVSLENRINFLTGRFPTPIERNSTQFIDIPFNSIQAGIPSQLLANRPDIRQAELELEASKLDVQVARANFYPSIGLKAGIGLQAFNPSVLFNPESILFSLVGDMLAPVVNRNALVAAYNSASARQIQLVYEYEQKVLDAHMDVLNQLAKIGNYDSSFQVKNKEVGILLESVKIANNLFYSARADYGEVLLTQREALDAKIDLIETKMQLLSAKVNIYRALGGGWQ